MTFVNYLELSEHVDLIARLIPKPDMVCAVPRSGLIPASMLALHWNVPLTTPHLLLKGETLGNGKRLSVKNVKLKNILVFDDSCNHGTTIVNVKKLLEPLTEMYGFKYGVVYATERTKGLLDYFLGTMEQPRHFQWNFLHHKELMELACFDIDGVLCKPPNKEENDYGPNYEKFLVDTPAWYVPTVPIGSICTGRLERYRALTEAWLEKNGVVYGELVMRTEGEPHPTGKINYFKSKPELKIFFEDEIGQAVLIKRNNPDKLVMCTKGWRMIPNEV